MPSFLAACGSSTQQAVLQPRTASVGGARPAEQAFEGVFGLDAATLQRTLAVLASRGADLAELYFQESRSTSVLYQDGIVAQAATSLDLGVGLRCVIGDQTGYAFTEELTPEALLAAANTAAAIAQGGQPVPPRELRRRELGRGLYRVAVPWRDVGIDQKLPRIVRAADMAKALDPAITKVEVRWSDEDTRVTIVTLDGRVLSDNRPMTRLWVNVTAEKDGQRQSNSANIAGRRGIDWYDDAQLDLVTRQAVDRTMILFEAGRPPAGELPVVLAAGPSGILLHEAIGHGMEADFNRKGTSIYASLIGEQVADPMVTIIDDGTLPNERGSLEVDDEGEPTERTVLVERGKLRTYLHDRISAAHYRVTSTGSGRRESFRHPIMPRMRCTFMENGPHTRDEIIASVQHGILAETFTNGQVQIGAGDYTFYIKNGYMIENGRLGRPIKDINIIGSGPETLRRISMVGNDAALDTGGWTCGKDGQQVPVSQGIPTVLVSKLVVGGENA